MFRFLIERICHFDLRVENNYLVTAISFLNASIKKKKNQRHLSLAQIIN